MKLESKESKMSTLAKGAIANIDWSLDSSRIVVCFKQHNQIVVWDVITTQRIIQIDFSPQQTEMNLAKNATWGPSASQSVSKVHFDKLNDNYLLISGVEAFLIMIDQSDKKEEKATPQKSTNGQKSVIRKHLSQCIKAPFVTIAANPKLEVSQERKEQTTPGQTPQGNQATPGSFTASGKRKLGLKQFVP